MDLLFVYGIVIKPVLSLILFLIFLILFFSYSKIVPLFKKIDKKVLLILLFLVTVGFFARQSFPHYHHMIIDEQLYLETAKNFHLSGKPEVCSYNTFEDQVCQISAKPPAWPFFLSFFYAPFGLNNYHALFIGSIIGSLCIIAIFFLSFLFFQDTKIALLSSFLLSINPLFIDWSASAETNMFSTFFMMIIIIFFLIYLRKPSIIFLLMTVLATGFTILVRFENIVLVPLISLFIIYRYSKQFHIRSRKVIIVIIYFLILSIMIFFEMVFIRIIRPLNPPFEKLFLMNIVPFTLSFTSNLIFLIIPLLIIIFWDQVKQNDKKRIIILTAFLIFYFMVYALIFIEDRMSLTPAIFAMILTAYTIIKLVINPIPKKYQNLVLFLIILFFVIIFSFGIVERYNDVQDKYGARVLETRLMQIIPQETGECYLVTDFPSVITSVSDLKVIPVWAAIRDTDRMNKIIKQNCVYYYPGISCIENDILRYGNYIDSCTLVEKLFNLTILKEYNNYNYTKTLYQMN